MLLPDVMVQVLIEVVKQENAAGCALVDSKQRLCVHAASQLSAMSTCKATVPQAQPRK